MIKWAGITPASQDLDWKPSNNEDCDSSSGIQRRPRPTSLNPTSLSLGLPAQTLVDPATDDPSQATFPSGINWVLGRVYFYRLVWSSSVLISIYRVFLFLSFCLTNRKVKRFQIAPLCFDYGVRGKQRWNKKGNSSVLFHETNSRC